METPTKTNLLGLAPAAMQAYFAELGEKPFRAGQVLQWIHQYGVDNFEAMTNLSKALRTRLHANIYFAIKYLDIRYKNMFLMSRFNI